MDNFEKNKSLDYFLLIILILLIADFEAFGILGRTTFMRDATHMFDVSYRISLSQIPYQDFYIPMGPISFYIQAFFNSLFGNNLFSLAFVPFILSCILCIYFYFIIRKESNPFLSLLFSFCLYLSFIGLSFHSFYNYTAFFFFILNIFLLINYYEKEKPPFFIFPFSVILSVFAFYSKQDIGLLHIFFVFLYFMFNYRKQWKFALFYLFFSFASIILIYFLLSNLGFFTHYFNIGLPPHNSRLDNFFKLHNIIKILTSWKFYLAMIFIPLLFFLKNTKKVKIISLFIIITAVTLAGYITSGSTRQLSVMGAPILIFLLILLIKDFFPNSIQNFKKFSFIMITIILLLVINPFLTYGLIVLNYANPDIGRISEGCLAGYPMPNEYIEELNKLRIILKENDYDFISLTEYSFLYCDYNINPPKKLPVLFVEGNSFFKGDIPLLINTILSYNPRVILVQDPHGHEDRTLNNQLISMFESRGYYKNDTVIGVSTTPITVLIKEE